MSAVQRTTTIGTRAVPIEEGDVPVVYFAEGRKGKAEAGLYEFWTVVRNQEARTARARVGRDPGERFRKLETQGDATSWEIAAGAEYIGPATEKAVMTWLGDKPDSQFAKWYYLKDKKFKVIRTPQGFTLEAVVPE